MRYQAALRPDSQYSNRTAGLSFTPCKLFAPAPLKFLPIHCMPTASPTLPWLEADSPFPAASTAWGAMSEAPGLLAAGADLSVDRLQDAYKAGIFPWFSAGQPVLWWSPDPRMVLQVADFRLHHSLRKTIVRFIANPGNSIRFDTAFEQVIAACAASARRGQEGTWIQPSMVKAYLRLHQAGLAHSVETWMDGQLVGGLYCVAIGKSVFGESMFTRVPDASKLALAALVGFCRAHAIHSIDCQQNTAHLASLGAREMPRQLFLEHVGRAQKELGVDWQFVPLYWTHILSA